ncbi:MAG TPA: hypothetical protein VGJ00_00215 [Rhabdochlamydiaceae bacterium]|jgi:hypothetical protein
MYRFLLFLFCAARCVIATPIQEYYFDSQALSELAWDLGIPSHADIVNETQKQWLRPSGKERWEMAELPMEKRKLVVQWAEKQGLLADRKPLMNTYDTALLFGAATPSMQKRLKYLKTLWEEGVRFKHIVWLTGDRPLDKRVDAFTERCSNESQAARVIWEEVELPAEMRELPIVFVEAPQKKVGLSLQRPSTLDTILTWLKTGPTPCKCLFISSQPYCCYQYAIVKSSLPEMFGFDVVGPRMDPDRHSASAAVILDTLARWIYQESL